MGKSSREKKERRMDNEGRAGALVVKNSKLERICFLIIEWGTYLILFTPLAFARSFYFPYVVPKTIFFRIIVDIIFIPYILLAVFNPRYRPRINALTVAIAVFLGITIIASVFGVNFERSFWSVFERMTGILTFLHLFVFLVILSSVFKEIKYWKRILTVSIIVGLLLCFYTWISTDPSAHSGGTVGNTSFMAGYLLFDIFFAIILLFSQRGFWKLFYGAALLILVLGLFVSQEVCRGAVGALFGGIFLLAFSYFVFYAFYNKKKILQRLIPVFIILIILITVGVLQLGFIKQYLAKVSVSSSWGARDVVWRMALKAWQEKFWLGWGLENFNIPFAKYFNPHLSMSGDFWYDRVHNVFLDTVINSGLLGLLSFLAIFAIAFFKLFKVSFRLVEKRNAIIPLGMMVLLAVYLAQNIWVFDMISSYMMFFLSLAFVSFLIDRQKTETAPKTNKNYSLLGASFGVLLIIVSLFTIYSGGIQPARASYYTVLGISLPLEEALPVFQKALKISPMSITETPEQISRRASELAYDRNVDKKLLVEGFQLAETEMKKSIASSPQDFRFYLLLGRQYNDFYYLTGDQEALRKADQTFQKARELSPNNQQVYWALAQTKLAQGGSKEAVEFMQKAVDLEPNFGMSHWYLAMTYKTLGDNTSAAKEIQEADRTEFDWKGNLDNLQKVIEVYQGLQDNNELISLYPLAMKLDPTKAQFPAGLAVAYANLGQFDQARKYAQEALALNPDFAPQIQEFLNQLPK